MKKLNELKTGELASFLGVTASFVSQARNPDSAKQFSNSQALKINKEFDVPLHEIRPDT